MTASHKPTLLIHGGAGAIPEVLNDEEARAIRAALTDALSVGYALLEDGKPALDAVVAAVSVLEDAPWFNAGHGAVYTHDGRHELDAAVMDGATLRAGSVAGLRHVRNPVQLARAVMEHSPHVMLAGAGAEDFAREVGVASVEPGYFDTPARYQQWRDYLRTAQVHATASSTNYFGTVGAVALDACGQLAAATSTGGMTGKRWGRIGDTPVIGAGTYANARAAVSCTGWGEFYLRTCAAHSICARIAAGETPDAAASAVIMQQIPALGGSGGAIALAADGRFALPFNTAGMYRGSMDAAGAARIAIGRGALRICSPR
ncbi:MAG: isoaspartyl peptidase/L-asparaginase family protein [Metallibacterium sp.]